MKNNGCYNCRFVKNERDCLGIGYVPGKCKHELNINNKHPNVLNKNNNCTWYVKMTLLDWIKNISLVFGIIIFLGMIIALLSYKFGRI